MNQNFVCSKFTYGIFKKANNKSTDQTVRMRRLVCTCVVCKPPKTGFLARRPINMSCVFFFSMDNLEQFVNDLLDNKLEAYMKSEAVPDNSNNDVKVYGT